MKNVILIFNDNTEIFRWPEFFFFYTLYLFFVHLSIFPPSLFFFFLQFRRFVFVLSPCLSALSPTWHFVVSQQIRIFGKMRETGGRGIAFIRTSYLDEKFRSFPRHISSFSKKKPRSTRNNYSRYFLSLASSRFTRALFNFRFSGTYTILAFNWPN